MTANPLTREQEAALRDATTRGDADTIHSAGVLAWRNLWALVDLLRDDAHKALAREDATINEVFALKATLAEVERERDGSVARINGHFRADGHCHESYAKAGEIRTLQDTLAEREAEIEQLREALRNTNRFGYGPDALGMIEHRADRVRHEPGVPCVLCDASKVLLASPPGRTAPVSAPDPRCTCRV